MEHKSRSEILERAQRTSIEILEKAERRARNAERLAAFLAGVPLLKFRKQEKVAFLFWMNDLECEWTIGGFQDDGHGFEDTKRAARSWLEHWKQHYGVEISGLSPADLENDGATIRELCTRRGAMSWLEKTGPELYRITRHGRLHFREYEVAWQRTLDEWEWNDE